MSKNKRGAIVPHRNIAKDMTLFAVSATIAVSGVGVVNLAGAAPAQAARTDIVNNNARQSQIDQIANEINSYRQAHGLKLVKLSPTISKIAQQESDRGVIDEDISHSGNFAKDARAGNWSKAGEISAANSDVNPHKLVEQWKNSPGHNRIMLDPGYTTIGVGVTKTDGQLQGGATWGIVSTVDFYQYDSKSEPSDAYLPKKPEAPKPTPSDPTPPGFENPKPQPIAPSIVDPSTHFTKVTTGDMKNFYEANGGQSTFGPIHNVYKDGRGGGSFMDVGSKYSIYAHPNGTVQAVDMSTPVGKLFADNGAENSVGYPVSNLQKLSGSNDTFYQEFSHPVFKSKSYIVWEKDKTPYMVDGSIADRWISQHKEIGNPSDMKRMVGLGNTIQSFEKSGVVTNLAQTKSGAKTEVKETSGIGRSWKVNGGAFALGIPTTNEYKAPDGSTKQNFSKGYVISWKNGQARLQSQ